MKIKLKSLAITLTGTIFMMIIVAIILNIATITIGQISIDYTSNAYQKITKIEFMRMFATGLVIVTMINTKKFIIMFEKIIQFSTNMKFVKKVEKMEEHLDEKIKAKKEGKKNGRRKK